MWYLGRYSIHCILLLQYRACFVTNTASQSKGRAGGFDFDPGAQS